MELIPSEFQAGAYDILRDAEARSYKYNCHLTIVKPAVDKLAALAVITP
jgi:hypothetical protein